MTKNPICNNVTDYGGQYHVFYEGPYLHRKDKDASDEQLLVGNCRKAVFVASRKVPVVTTL